MAPNPRAVGWATSVVMLGVAALVSVSGGRPAVEVSSLTPAPPAGAAARPRVRALPAPHFEENAGHLAESVQFVRRCGAGTLFVVPSATVLVVRAGEARAVVRTDLVGSDPKAVARGERELPWRTNHFHGDDPARWRTGVRGFEAVRVSEVWPGIDLVFRGDGDGDSSLGEYDFEVAPGADPAAVRVRFAGATDARIDSAGGLVLDTPAGAVRHGPPKVFQETNGARTPLAAAWRLHAGAVPQATFALAAHDASLPLVIDPVIEFVTYVGGSGADRSPRVAVDAAGGAYLFGETSSDDFPPDGTLQAAQAPDQGFAKDAFVVKVRADGTGIEWGTYLGGNDFDEPGGIALGNDGSVYIAGMTESSNFPVTVGAARTQHAGGEDAFVARISGDGQTLHYATYLGGALDDVGFDVAVDGDGSAYVVGETKSDDYPVVGGVGGNTGTSTDAFLTKLNLAGTQIAYSTYLAGNNFDSGRAVAVDGARNAYVAGVTTSDAFPLLTTGVQPALAGGRDAFVVKILDGGAAAGFGTYVGGTGNEVVGTDTADVALGPGEVVVVAGSTQSDDFPTSPGAFQQTRRGADDGFVTVLAADGQSRVSSTLFGGSGPDSCVALVVDGAGRAHVAGTTESADFPVAGAAPRTKFLGGDRDAYLAIFDPAGASLVLSTFVSGKRFDEAEGLARDVAGNVYVSGDNIGGKLLLTGAFDGKAQDIEPWLAKYSFPDGAGAVGKLSVKPKAKLPKVAPGGESRRNVTVKNASKTDALVVTVEEPAAPFVVLGGRGATVVPPRGALTILVAFRPLAPGPAAGTLRLTSTDSRKPTVDVALSATAP